MFTRRIVALAAGMAAVCVLAIMASGPAAATVSPAIGTTTTEVAISQCSGNQVIVGLYVNFSDRVVALTPLCADASSGPWDQASAKPGTQLGAGGSPVHVRTCFSPQALYGAQAAVRKSDGAIVGMKIICGDIPFSDDVGSMAGGVGIAKTAAVCGPGLTAVGIRAWFTDSAHTTVSGFALQCLNAPASVGGVAAVTPPATGGSAAASSSASSSAGGGSSGGTSGGSSGSGGAVVTPSFSGAWNVKVSDGTSFVMNLKQTGSKVSGTYDTGGRDGEINGKVSGSVFTYTWKLTGSMIANGGGSMTLAADGKSWHGDWTMKAPLPAMGTWDGSW